MTCLQHELEELCRWTYTAFGQGALDDKLAAAEAATLMRKLDVNSDGVISLDEFQAYFEAQATKTAKVAARMVKLGKAPPKDMFNAD